MVFNEDRAGAAAGGLSTDGPARPRQTITLITNHLNHVYNQKTVIKNNVHWNSDLFSPQLFSLQNSHKHSPVFFMTELKLLRIEPILARSTLSKAAAEGTTGGVTCVIGCSVITDGSGFAGSGVDTSELVDLIWSSTEEKICQGEQ